MLQRFPVFHSIPFTCHSQFHTDAPPGIADEAAISTHVLPLAPPPQNQYVLIHHCDHVQALLSQHCLAVSNEFQLVLRPCDIGDRPSTRGAGEASRQCVVTQVSNRGNTYTKKLIN